MGLFDKFFGTKEPAEKVTTARKAAEPGAVDFVSALSLHLHDQLDAALAAYGKIIDDNPEDILALFFAAAIRAGKGEIAEAAEGLRSLSAAIASRGEVISRSIVFEVTAVATPSRLPAIAHLCIFFGEQLKTGRFLREAVVVQEIASALAPDNANVLHKFADSLHDLRIYDYAEKVLQEALRLAPNHWGALYTYAVLLQDLGRDEEALVFYEKAAKFDPYHVNCRNNYGAALLRTNRVEEALVQCQAAAELDPEAPLVKVNLGNIYLLKRDYEAARTCFTEAIAVNENLAPAHLGLGQIEESTGGDPERARELYVRALQINPGLAELYPALKPLLA